MPHVRGPKRNECSGEQFFQEPKKNKSNQEFFRKFPPPCLKTNSKSAFKPVASSDTEVMQLAKSLIKEANKSDKDVQNAALPIEKPLAFKLPSFFQCVSKATLINKIFTQIITGKQVGYYEIQGFKMTFGIRPINNGSDCQIVLNGQINSIFDRNVANLLKYLTYYNSRNMARIFDLQSRNPDTARFVLHLTQQIARGKDCAIHKVAGGDVNVSLRGMRTSNRMFDECKTATRIEVAIAANKVSSLAIACHAFTLFPHLPILACVDKFPMNLPNDNNVNPIQVGTQGKYLGSPRAGIVTAGIRSDLLLRA